MAINCTNVLVLLWWKSWQRKIFSLRNTMICFLKDASKTDTGTCTSYILKLASRAQSKILCSILSDNKWHWFINFEPLALQFNLYISLKTCIMLHEIQQDWFNLEWKIILWYFTIHNDTTIISSIAFLDRIYFLQISPYVPLLIFQETLSCIL